MNQPSLALVTPDTPIAAIMRTPVASVAEDDTLTEVAQVLVDNEIGAVAVLRHDRVLGVVSERDMVGQIAAGTEMDLTTAGDIMTTDLVTVDPAEPIIAAAQRANAALVRHLPVLDDQRNPLGFVSVRDLLAVLVAAIPESR